MAGAGQIKVNMSSFPESGNVPVWQREICALYRRYTGVDPCQMDDQLIEDLRFKPYYYNTRSMWSASSTRIRQARALCPPCGCRLPCITCLLRRRHRSLPVTEYQWMREYLMSVTFEDGVKRRYVPERIWQAMLGCPSEINTRHMVGCTSLQWHPSGQAVEPPGVITADALVTWPQNGLETFSADAPYPSFLRTHNITRITFVGKRPNV